MPLMQVIQSIEQLFYDHFGLIFWKLPIGGSLKMCMQAFTPSILHDKIYIFDSIDTFVKLDDIWMFQLRKNLYFSNCLFLALKIKKLISIILLYSNLFSCFLVY